ncbi:hypothetical protein DPEC_G00058150 [Dallia pectoralis]|uniref:Uncharacterized protein n=1 Tax=Dallia pectoralis TaxID=75939 RepID=A0ACC2H694_DALPE|nr:hypothetical protein DPEC_G00058150 [Dallia pectoralis]
MGHRAVFQHDNDPKHTSKTKLREKVVPDGYSVQICSIAFSLYPLTMAQVDAACPPADRPPPYRGVTTTAPASFTRR